MPRLERIRQVGQMVWFEYHCLESHSSCDAEIWYRSHQQVTVIAGPSFDGQQINPDEDGIPVRFNDRMDSAIVLNYRVRWADGFEYDVFEDELLDKMTDFERPDPPQRPAP